MEVELRANSLACVAVQIQHYAGVLGGQSLGSAHLHRPCGNVGGPAAKEGSAGLIYFLVLLIVSIFSFVSANVFILSSLGWEGLHPLGILHKREDAPQSGL